MHKILNCRRSLIAIFAISCLTMLGMYHGQDISGIAVAIAGIAGGVAGSNAWENRGKAAADASVSVSRPVAPIPPKAPANVDCPD